MGIFQKRLLGFLCGVFLLTVYLQSKLWLYDIDLRLPLLFAALLLLCLGGLGTLYRILRLKSSETNAFLLSGCGLLLALISLQWSVYGLYGGTRQAFLKLSEESSACVFQGTVTEFEEYSESFGVVTLRLSSLNGETCRGSAELTVSLLESELPGISSLSLGDEVYGEGNLQRVPLSENGFALREYQASKDVLVNGELTALSVSDKDPSLFQRLRTVLSQTLDRYLSAETAGLSKALLLGDRSGIATTVSRDFRALGVTHLLAVSGLHLTVLTGALGFVLEKLRVRRGTRLFWQCGFVLFFTALCGFGGSVTRAGLLFLVTALSTGLGRKSDRVTALFLAGTLILLPQPLRVLDTGLQLSFLATLGILCQSQPKCNKQEASKHPIFQKLHRFLLSPLSVGVSALFFTLPVSTAIGGSFSPLSPLFTLLLSPLFTVFLYLAPLVLLLCRVRYLGGFFCFLLEKVSDCILAITETADVFQKFRIPLSDSTTLLLTAVSAVLVLLYLFWKRKPSSKGTVRFLAVFPAAALLLFCLGGFGLSRITDNHSATLLYCEGDNQNEAFLLREQEETFYIDLSTGSSSMDRLVGQYLPAVNDCNIDALVLTHLHARHGALIRRMAETYYVNRLYLPYPESDSDRNLFPTFLIEAESLGLDVILYRRTGEAFALSEDFFLSVTAEWISRSTHPVLSLCFSANAVDGGSISLLYLGASFPAGSVSPTAALAADGILFGNHGPVPKDSDDTAFGDLFSEESVLLLSSKNREPEIYQTQFGERLLVLSEPVRRFVFAAAEKE